jgi:hypothetical protein
MIPSQPTDVSPGQIIQGGQHFTSVEGDSADILSNMDYDIAALNNPWGEDTPGKQFQDGTWDPVMNSTHAVFAAFGLAMTGMSNNVSATGLLYNQSNQAATENVNDIHIAT